MNKQLQKLKPKIVKILKEHNIAKAGVFGSYATGEAKKDSDIDILIEFNGSLLKLVALERKLKKALNKRVDLITYNGINHLLKKRILKEEVKLYG